jgi:ornithine--oxo-acid transaminase
MMLFKSLQRSAKLAAMPARSFGAVAP